MSWAIEAKRKAIEEANKQLEEKKRLQAAQEAVWEDEKKKRDNKERLAKEDFEKKFAKFVPVIRKFFKDLIKAGIIEKHKEKRQGFFGLEYYKEIDDETFENPSITFQKVETTEDNWTKAHKNGAPVEVGSHSIGSNDFGDSTSIGIYYVLELVAHCVDWYIFIKPIFADKDIKSFEVNLKGTKTILKNGQDITDFENFLIETAKKCIFNAIQQETLKNL